MGISHAFSSDAMSPRKSIDNNHLRFVLLSAGGAKLSRRAANMWWVRYTRRRGLKGGRNSIAGRKAFQGNRFQTETIVDKDSAFRLPCFAKEDHCHFSFR
jgi:hypothetical protein